MLHLLACVISTWWFFVGFYSITLMVKWRRLRRDALSTSLVFCTFALASTAILTGSATRFVVETIPPNSQGSKTDTLTIGNISLVFSFLFTTLCMLNTSLVWIEIGENANKMHKSEGANIVRYRRLLFGYYMLFLVLIIVSAALNNSTFTALAALPGILFVVAAYLVGYFRIRKMLLT